MLKNIGDVCSMDKMEIGNRIKLARVLYQEKTGNRMTQAMLAKAVGISRSFLGDAENGHSLPTIITLNEIAKACDVNLDFFVNPSFSKDEIPKELKELGIEYLVVTKELKDRGLTPEEIKKLSEIAEMFKNK
jgi:transcriptional regulator with XRE-family HTH domain